MQGLLGLLWYTFITIFWHINHTVVIPCQLRQHEFPIYPGLNEYLFGWTSEWESECLSASLHQIASNFFFCDSDSIAVGVINLLDPERLFQASSVLSLARIFCEVRCQRLTLWSQSTSSTRATPALPLVIDNGQTQSSSVGNYCLAMVNHFFFFFFFCCVKLFQYYACL